MEEQYFITNKMRYTANFIEMNFKKNGIDLEKDDNSNYTKTDFISEIQQQVGNYVNRNFEQIVVLGGAGSSISGDEFGKTVFELAKTIDSALSEEGSLYSIKKMAKLCRYSYDDIGNDKFNLEDFISQIRKATQFIPNDKKAKYESTQKEIFDVIKSNTNYSYDSRKLKQGAFINILANKVKAPNKLTIATTNYDVLFEEAALDMGYTVIDGFTFSPEAYFDADIFEWNLVRDIPNLKTKELEYKKKVINLIKLHGSVTWEREGDKIIRKKKEKVEEPVMIFPSSDKYLQSYEEPYFELFSKFQEVLNRPNTLLITTGFSFGDSHIATMISRAITHNHGLSVLVTDFSLNKTTDGWKSLVSHMESGHSIVFLKSSFADLPSYLGGVTLC
ncbi:SIR2 family protein [Listeria booriae]|uniref:SIR2 family protein n=1 Tax=Listeria booriae TaxID=1552123 RepID=UPI00164CE7E9|nr:SIR2 family protein [Listeria booriae]MBC6164638.1 SIR2 family protein [Listeria booriae]